MKKHIFGFGVMIVGVVLMFVFMGSEVYALTGIERQTEWWQVENWLSSTPGIFLLALFAYSFFKMFLYDKEPLGIWMFIWFYVAMDGDLWIARSGKSFMHVIWTYPGFVIGIWLCLVWKKQIERTGELFKI